MKVHTEYLSIAASTTTKKKKDSFDIFAKDIPITEQEVVLQKKKVLITTECHKIYKH